jgi:cell cycle sensor histidine kinase DivJ
MAALSIHQLHADPGSALGVVLAVVSALCLGHFVAQAVCDRRLDGLLRSARRDGAARENLSLQAIDDLVTWHDRHGQVLRVNAGAARMVGALGAMLQGRGLFARIHVSDRPAFLKAISDAATSAEPVAVQFRLQTGEIPASGPGHALGRPSLRSAGPLIWVEMRAHRLQDEDGCAVVAVTRDITAHKQLAEDLDALRREAVLSGENRAQLLATVSHELRTPLNAMIGYAEMLMSQTPADQSPLGNGGVRKGGAGHGLASVSNAPFRHDYAEIIQQSGHHMLGVVNTLLDLSTIEAGHYDLTPEAIEVGDLVDECCRCMALIAERSGVVLAHDIAPGLPAITADRRACRQILLNLLSNAVKFTPRGGLITVLARRDADKLALTVRDTGVGVCATELQRLGDPFYRGSSAADHAEKGSGLGLSVVRGLVGLHHGRIAIASARGNGTDVTVTLPLDPGRPAQPAGPAQVHAIVRPMDRSTFNKTGTKSLA